LRVIRANKPTWGIYENVKNLVGKEFKETTFKLFLDELHEHGYNTYWQVLNAKNYGIPQNRERVYLILIKKEVDNGKFVFPQPFDNGKRLKDLLDDIVDEKYYVSSERLAGFITALQETDTGNYTVKVGNIYPSGGQNGNVYSRGGISPTILSGETATKGNGGIGSCNAPKTVKNARVRKLTPKECFRLMGFTDEDYYKAEKVNSYTQLYKQAGNSIVVDVLYYIYVELYKAMPYLFDNLKVGSYFSGIGAFEKALDRLYAEINNA
jgi:DNA-cytosine methyltransferase